MEVPKVRFMQVEATSIPGVLHVCEGDRSLSGIPHVGEDDRRRYPPGLDPRTEPWLATLPRRVSMVKEMVTAFFQNHESYATMQIRDVCKRCTDFQRSNR